MDRVSVETNEPGVVVIALAGEHDLYGATQLQQQLERATVDASSVVVDLSHAEFIDSTVVAVLLDAQKLIEGRGLDYRLVMTASTGEPVSRMLGVNGLTRILPVVLE